MGTRGSDPTKRSEQRTGQGPSTLGLLTKCHRPKAGTGNFWKHPAVPLPRLRSRPKNCSLSLASEVCNAREARVTSKTARYFDKLPQHCVDLKRGSRCPHPVEIWSLGTSSKVCSICLNTRARRAPFPMKPSYMKLCNVYPAL